ncbi:endonuclease domain-containing protein [candidate division KSB1 bacterium]|nr:endonuclease domain-containing protein [candidate division KSB1 bacterium]
MPSKITILSRNLRKRATEAERLLWKHPRRKQLGGPKFRRQQPIGNYILDFVCFEKRIIIELDGGQYATQTEKDSKREKWFSNQGFKVIRFWNNEVLKIIYGVSELIREHCSNHPPLTPPIKGGECKY